MEKTIQMMTPYGCHQSQAVISTNPKHLQQITCFTNSLCEHSVEVNLGENSMFCCVYAYLSLCYINLEKYLQKKIVLFGVFGN